MLIMYTINLVAQLNLQRTLECSLLVCVLVHALLLLPVVMLYYCTHATLLLIPIPYKYYHVTGPPFHPLILFNVTH